MNLLESDFNDVRACTEPDERGYSIEDRRFMEIVENWVRFADGKYEVPMPFRTSPVVLPNNQSQALMRMKWQSRKMISNPEYGKDYVNFIQTLIDKGYCEPVDDDGGDAWFLPHHGVYHPHKPGKIRVVFDCSAKHQGNSLNDQLLQGPDLANNLWGVLTRFRLDQVAFVSDLEAMFYQIKVPIKDRRYLRFFWWADSKIGGEIVQLQMTVHIFGAASSPSVANFVIRLLAAKAEDEEVKKTLANHFYVDDCLRSVAGVEACKELVEKLRTTCSKGGFHLTKFQSTSKEVLQSLPKSERAKEVQELDLVFNELPMSRALGVLWEVHTDQFRFSVQLTSQPTTRREILAFTASLYDPLGFVAPVVLTAKQVLQQLCNEKIGWDNPLPADLRAGWEKWLKSLPSLNDVWIARCFFPWGRSACAEAKMHVFCDASSTGYGAVAYFRSTDADGKTHESFIAGKSRVAPVKFAQTIPRLEMAAATTAVRLACLAKKEIGREMDIDVAYYTHSEIVLQSIKNDKKRFPVYMANRINLIRQFSSPQQWYHVASNLNPADEGSRGISAADISSSKWLNGPDFNQLQSSCCAISTTPPAADDGAADDDAEPGENATKALIEHFSSFSKLVRIAAIYRRLEQEKTATWLPISKDETDSAEIALVRFTQQTHFSEEISSLKAKGCVKKSSSVRNLDPFLDESGLLRVGGHLRQTKRCFGAKHPILLPKADHFSVLVIRHYHEKYAHVGRYHVLSLVRERFWILHGNAAVRRVIENCVRCRKNHGPTMTQKMADVPEERTSCDPPFTHSGVDIFGPFIIKDRRKEVKRYDAIFTCMASRAIHIEVVHTLETTSFLNALRRFIARRGSIKTLFCDNGTNLVGTRGELERLLLGEKIEWRFNPPQGSHMGGSLERLIRSVWAVLKPLLDEFGT
jgi:hypothetical protein